MKLTKNFYLHEFDCKDGSKVPDALIDNVKDTAEESTFNRFDESGNVIVEDSELSTAITITGFS